MASGAAEGGAAGATARGGDVALTPQPDGSTVVDAPRYRALIGADGNLHSLRIGEAEMLDDRVAISLGSFFYANGARVLPEVNRPEPNLLTATDGTFRAQYRFLADEIRVALSNGGEGAAPYFMVLSPQISIATNAPSGEAAAAPANEPWGNVRFVVPSGAYMELTGGSRIWGPWLGRQVWEVGRIAQGEEREIRVRPGVGDAPKATLGQLIGMRVRVASDNALVPADEPIELEVAIENRSDRALSALLSLELSGSRSELILYSASSVQLPPKKVTTASARWGVGVPDFYAARVTLSADGREIAKGRAVAGYGVEGIRPAVQRPAEFEEFWQDFLSEVGDGLPQFRMVLDEARSRRGVAVWVVQYEGIGGRSIHGWYIVPRGPEPAPALLYLSGYGARPIEPPMALAGRGYVVLAIDVRGNRVDRARPRPFETYCTEGVESPESYVYREILGHTLRAVHFLRAREELDPARIGVVGVSEGGGLALLLAALSPDIRAVAADAPMMCDLPLSVRSGAWPYTEIARYVRQRPDAAGRVALTLAHFDAVNFAPDVKCPVLLSVGFLDSVSLPTAVYGFANQLAAPNEVRGFPEAGHEVGGEDLWSYKLEWLARALSATPAR